jgi:hypothetical protein
MRAKELESVPREVTINEVWGGFVELMERAGAQQTD